MNRETRAVVTDLDQTIIHSISSEDMEKKDIDFDFISKIYKFDVMMNEHLCYICKTQALYIENSKYVCEDHKSKNSMKLQIDNPAFLNMKKKRQSLDEFLREELENNVLYIVKSTTLKELESYKMKIKNHIVIAEKSIAYYVFFRPYFREYLKFCSEDPLSLTIWTAATRDYADFVRQRFDTNINFLFFDEHVDISEKKKLKKQEYSLRLTKLIKAKYHHKDLEFFKQQLMLPENSVIVDDRSYVHDDQPHEAIHLRAFMVHHDKHFENNIRDLELEEKNDAIIIKGKRAVYYDLLVKLYNRIYGISQIPSFGTEMDVKYFIYPSSKKRILEKAIDRFEDRSLIAVMYILNLWVEKGYIIPYKDILSNSADLELPKFISNRFV